MFDLGTAASVILIATIAFTGYVVLGILHGLMVDGSDNAGVFVPVARYVLAIEQLLDSFTNLLRRTSGTSSPDTEAPPDAATDASGLSAWQHKQIQRQAAENHQAARASGAAAYAIAKSIGLGDLPAAEAEALRQRFHNEIDRILQGASEAMLTYARFAPRGRMELFRTDKDVSAAVSGFLDDVRTKLKQKGTSHEPREAQRRPQPADRSA